MKQFLLDLIIRHPLFILIAVAVITILFGLGLRHGLPLNVSPLLFVEEHSREREDYNRIRQTFGDDLFLVVAVESDDVFAPASLAKLRALHQQIEKLNGIAEIISLSNAPYARGEANSVTLEKLIPDLPGLAPARLAEARNIALSDKLFAGQIVARDGKTAALNILLKAELSTDARYAVTAQICEVAKRAGFSRVFFAGDPFSQWRGVEAIRHDLTLFFAAHVVVGRVPALAVFSLARRCRVAFADGWNWVVLGLWPDGACRFAIQYSQLDVANGAVGDRVFVCDSRFQSNRPCECGTRNAERGIGSLRSDCGGAAIHCTSCRGFCLDHHCRFSVVGFYENSGDTFDRDFCRRRSRSHDVIGPDLCTCGAATD